MSDTRKKTFDVYHELNFCYIYKNDSRQNNLTAIIEEKKFFHTPIAPISLPQKIRSIYETFHTSESDEYEAISSTLLDLFTHTVHFSKNTIAMRDIAESLDIVADYMKKNIYAAYHYLQTIHLLNQLNFLSGKIHENALLFTRNFAIHLLEKKSKPFSFCFLMLYLYLAKEVAIPFKEQQAIVLAWLNHFHCFLPIKKLSELVSTINKTSPILLSDSELFKKILTLISYFDANNIISLSAFDRRVNILKEQFPFQEFCTSQKMLVKERLTRIHAGSFLFFNPFLKNTSIEEKVPKIKNSCLIL